MTSVAWSLIALIARPTSVRSNKRRARARCSPASSAPARAWTQASTPGVRPRRFHLLRVQRIRATARWRRVLWRRARRSDLKKAFVLTMRRSVFPGPDGAQTSNSDLRALSTLRADACTRFSSAVSGSFSPAMAASSCFGALETEEDEEERLARIEGWNKNSLQRVLDSLLPGELRTVEELRAFAFVHSGWAERVAPHEDSGEGTGCGSFGVAPDRPDVEWVKKTLPELGAVQWWDGRFHNKEPLPLDAKLQSVDRALERLHEGQPVYLDYFVGRYVNVDIAYGKVDGGDDKVLSQRMDKEDVFHALFDLWEREGTVSWAVRVVQVQRGQRVEYDPYPHPARNPVFWRTTGRERTIVPGKRMSVGPSLYGPTGEFDEEEAAFFNHARDAFTRAKEQACLEAAIRKVKQATAVREPQPAASAPKRAKKA